MGNLENVYLREHTEFKKHKRAGGSLTTPRTIYYKKIKNELL